MSDVPRFVPPFAIASLAVVSLFSLFTLARAFDSPSAKDLGSTESIATGSEDAGLDDSHSSEFAPPDGNPPFHRGWPIEMGLNDRGQLPWGVALADVDNDGDMEVLSGSSNGLFFIWDEDGRPLPGWPVYVGGRVLAKCAVGDLDRDGDLEVVIASSMRPLTRISVLEHDGSPVDGWPIETAGGYGPISPNIADLDQDGLPEIVRGGHTRIFAWHSNGKPVDGFPIKPIGRVVGTLAVGDLLGGAAPEIVAITVVPELEYNAFVTVFDADGSVLPGWPVYLREQSSWSSPSIGNIDGLGLPEILVTSFDDGTSLWAFDSEGDLVSGFPARTASPQSYSTPVIGDIDMDGDLEIFQTVKALEYNFHAWDHHGDPLPGWPANAQWNMECSPLLGNLDSDDGIEAIAADNVSPGYMYGYDIGGKEIYGYPFSMLPGIVGPSSPAIGDVDGDGDLDLAMTMYRGTVGVWDLGVPWDAALAEWPSGHHDNWNSNTYGFVPLVGSTTDFESPVLWSTDVGRTLEAFPNPSVGPVRFSLRNPGSEDGTLAGLVVFDPAGRMVYRSGSGKPFWDGRDLRGRQVSSGRYLVEGRVVKDEARITTWITILR